MEKEEPINGKDIKDVIPKTYHDEFLELLDSHDRLTYDVRKVLFRLGKEKRPDLLTELKEWIRLGMHKVFYEEKYVKPRTGYSRQLDEWDLECALAEDHVSLQKEDYGDFVRENEYPATDVWIERKEKEFFEFYHNELPLLLNNRGNINEARVEKSREETYAFPQHLIDDDFPKKDLLNETFKIDTKKSYAELKEILIRFEDVLDKENLEALLYNMFDFPANPYSFPETLKLIALHGPNRGPLKHQFFTLYEDFYSIFGRGTNKDVFGKILFCNFWEDRIKLIEEQKNFKVHLDNLTKSVRKNPNRTS